MKTARNLFLASILTVLPSLLYAAFGLMEASPLRPQRVSFPSEIQSVAIFSSNQTATATISLIHVDPNILPPSNTFTTVIAGPSISPATTNITFSTPIYALPGDTITISGVDSTNGTTRAYIFLKQ